MGQEELAFQAELDPRRLYSSQELMARWNISKARLVDTDSR